MPASSPALNALYRMVPAPGGGSIPVRRPPKETTPELAALSSRNPSDATLITLTAREYEAQLDFTNAEARWKMLDAASSDRAAGPIALAEVGLPERAIPVALLFFNVGVEIGQLVFVAAVLGLFFLLTKIPRTWPRWAEAAPAYAIGAVAMVWVIDRITAFAGP